jgi:hypothetical protein
MFFGKKRPFSRVALVSLYLIAVNGLLLAAYGPLRTAWGVDRNYWGIWRAQGELWPHLSISRALWFWQATLWGANLLALLTLLERWRLLPYYRARESADPSNPWLAYFFHPPQGSRRERRLMAARAMAWLVAPATLLLYLAGSWNPDPAQAWQYLFSRGFALGLIIGGAAWLAPVVGWIARRRLDPLAEQTLTSPLTPRDYIAAIHGTVFEGVLFAQRMAVVWWVLCIHVRLTQWDAARLYWALNPGALIFGAALLLIWAGNYAAGFYLRATMAATIQLFCRFPVAAATALNFAALASVIVRFYWLRLLFIHWPGFGFLPESLWGPQFSYARVGGSMEIVLVATAFEGALMLGRFWLARLLWRRMEERGPIQEFGGLGERGEGD